jgi:hypothetical protein
VTDVVAACLRAPNLLAKSAQYFPKEVGAGSFVEWHQDTFDPIFDNALTAWIALTPSTKRSGRVVTPEGCQIGSGQQGSRGCERSQEKFLIRLSKHVLKGLTVKFLLSSFCFKKKLDRREDDAVARKGYRVAQKWTPGVLRTA